MKRYIFRLNWNGFYDWCHHVNEAKGIIHTHQTLNSQTKEWHKEEYQEAKVLMETYCIISNKLTEPMKDYLKANINHKTPSRKITMKDMKEAFRIWRMTRQLTN